MQNDLISDLYFGRMCAAGKGRWPLIDAILTLLHEWLDLSVVPSSKLISLSFESIYRIKIKLFNSIHFHVVLKLRYVVSMAFQNFQMCDLEPRSDHGYVLIVSHFGQCLLDHHLIHEAHYRSGTLIRPGHELFVHQGGHDRRVFAALSWHLVGDHLVWLQLHVSWNPHVNFKYSTYFLNNSGYSKSLYDQSFLLLIGLLLKPGRQRFTRSRRILLWSFLTCYGDFKLVGFPSVRLFFAVSLLCGFLFKCHLLLKFGLH